MKRFLILFSVTAAGTAAAFAQSAIDAYRISQPDMKGTARFMSMGGAFGALGGDLSSLSQNPAGIGVYRSGDFGFTFDLDFQNSQSNSKGMTTDWSATKFLLNNIGGVVTLRLPSQTVRNLNIGFTYNKATSYNRQYAGTIPNLSNSLSNYVAGICNGERVTLGDVVSTNKFDPYNPNDGGYAAPWISILGYDGRLVTPSDDSADAVWYGQWGNGTSGAGSFAVKESGSLDEYNIAFGGNISDVLYWGMNFDIINVNYTLRSRWSESLDNAYVADADDVVSPTTADWDLTNYYNVNGSGFNYQLGVILKPIQELRLGVAVHTPTWFSLTENYGASLDYSYGSGINGGTDTNNGELAYNNMDFRTPWKVIGSIAGVLGNNLILSLDYEWTPYNKMHFAEPGSYGGILSGPGGWDDGFDWFGPYGYAKQGTTRSYLGPDQDIFYDTNSDIRQYYKSTNTVRVGAEYRVTPAFSLRAGYCNVNSPVKQSVSNDLETIYTSGTLPNYRFDNKTNYITCGLGYKFDRFYVDLAYVYKNMKSTYHAYTPDFEEGTKNVIPSPQSSLSLTNNQVVLTAGFRF